MKGLSQKENKMREKLMGTDKSVVAARGEERGGERGTEAANGDGRSLTWVVSRNTAQMMCCGTAHLTPV